jgi:hypothetical protein
MAVAPTPKEGTGPCPVRNCPEWQVFAKEGTVGSAPCARSAPQGADVYIEAYGEVQVTADQIASAHDGKVS